MPECKVVKIPILYDGEKVAVYRAYIYDLRQGLFAVSDYDVDEDFEANPSVSEGVIKSADDFLKEMLVRGRYPEVIYVNWVGRDRDEDGYFAEEGSIFEVSVYFRNRKIGFIRVFLDVYGDFMDWEYYLPDKFYDDDIIKAMDDILEYVSDTKYGCKPKFIIEIVKKGNSFEVLKCNENEVPIFLNGEISGVYREFYDSAGIFIDFEYNFYKDYDDEEEMIEAIDDFLFGLTKEEYPKGLEIIKKGRSIEVASRNE